ncbi:hypothetical protein ACFX19_040441 [Malus domestica]
MAKMVSGFKQSEMNQFDGSLLQLKGLWRRWVPFECASEPIEIQDGITRIGTPSGPDLRRRNGKMSWKSKL